MEKEKYMEKRIVEYEAKINLILGENQKLNQVSIQYYCRFCKKESHNLRR